jgi:hypothetical protein
MMPPTLLATQLHFLKQMAPQQTIVQDRLSLQQPRHATLYLITESMAFYNRQQSMHHDGSNGRTQLHMQMVNHPEQPDAAQEPVALATSAKPHSPFLTASTPIVLDRFFGRAQRALFHNSECP